MRVLSDLSLMLRDYDTALSTLRLLASDFKQDKAWKHYAAVQEALGATIIMMGGSHADAAAHLKEAFYRYQQVCQLSSMNNAEKKNRSGHQYLKQTKYPTSLLSKHQCETSTCKSDGVCQQHKTKFCVFTINAKGC